MNPNRDDTRHEELQRQVSEGKAAQILIEADIVRIDKDSAGKAIDIALLIHEVRGDGVKGIASRLEDVEALLSINPKEAKAGRYNTLGVVATVIGGLLTLTGIGAWFMGLFKK